MATISSGAFLIRLLSMGAATPVRGRAVLTLLVEANVVCVAAALPANPGGM